MIKKRLLVKIMMLGIISMSLFFLTACDQASDNGGNDIEWTDTASRPEIAPLEEGKYISYPDKPTTTPGAVNENELPTISGYSASNDSGYTINEDTEGNTVISYSEVQDWSYVYVSVENYQPKYGNIKISANGNGAERIAIQAVYYEMYDEGNPAITVYRGDIADGAQYFISILKDQKLLDSSYNTITESNLAEKTVIGFLLFIDSNPSQIPTSDKSGSLTITGFEFLLDGDEALKDRYVAPSVNIGFMDTGYTAERLESGSIHIEREAGTSYWTKVYLPIVNYSADYSAFNIKLNTTGVKSYKIELELSPEGNDWQPSVEMLTKENVTDGVHEHYIDFSVTQPISSLPPYNSVPGYLIKNYKVNSILIYLDTYKEGVVPDFSASADIELLEFQRTAVDGTTISKGWSPGSSYVSLGEDVLAGGVGSINFSWHQDWYYLGMPVINYEKADKLVVKVAAPDGLDNLGIAVTASGWEYVLHSSWIQLEGAATVLDELTGSLEGIVETLEYDEATSIYTFTFDFTNAVPVDLFNVPLNEMPITLLRFYLNDPADDFDAYFDGTRTVRFVSVTLE